MTYPTPAEGARRRRLRTTYRDLPPARRLLVVLSGLLAFTVMGIAVAAWTVEGDGEASARATTPVQVTVTPDPSQPADLYPGNANGTLYFMLDNPGTSEVTFTAMTPGAVTVDSGHSGCDPDTNITVAAKTGLAITVPAGTPSNSPVQRSIASAISMDANAPAACQGAVFTISVTLTGSMAS